MIRAILTDIEGTTSSIAFVHEILFPYARAHLASFVQDHQHDPRVVEYLAEARQEAGTELDAAGVIAQLIAWIDADRKIPALKALQGMIWETGYRAGAFTSHLYEDAYRCLTKWHDAGIQLYVFSSGSVAAQRLFFAYTEWGDLRPLFSGYFDTRTGPKSSPDSYYAIAKAMGVPTPEICFLSDVRAELDAARTVGLHTRWLVRTGTTNPHASHAQVTDFDTIDLSTCDSPPDNRVPHRLLRD
jgi:enolase-phosphatase E1